MSENRLIVGISGASGAALGVEVLRQLHALGVKSHVIVSDAARQTLAHECGLKLDELHALADSHYANAQIGAAPASGSFRSLGMIVAPCSIRSMSEIATGVTSTLLTRAADVTLKERRRLVLMVRETPLHSGHLRTMLELSNMGAVIAPPVPAFYAKPQSVADIVANSVGRALDLFGLNSPDVLRWGEGHARTHQP